MYYLNELQHSGFIWLCLALTVISAFYSKRLWLAPLAVTLVLALIYQHLTFVGAAVLLAGFALAGGQQFLSGKVKTLVQGVVVVWCLALAAHLLPGFNNLHVLDQVTTGAQSLPFTLYLNLDKPMLFFALLLMLPGMLNRQVILPGIFQAAQEQHVSVGKHVKPVFGISGAIGLIFITAFLMELILLEFSLPGWWWLFAINNLLFTCVAEEAFFRGFIQQKLTEKFSLKYSAKTAAYGAMAIASVLFGLAHFGGGVAYVVVATLAGALYGFTYLYSGRLSVAIVVHFLLNMLHLLFFTYPMAKF
ncbi:CPBP family intramembrane glutamic endopeptidase [Thalassomonas sp. RHCl1]|uniref:CPBP family intramembrane glutamic endopeptidase n=1 Tax=Thalassomonas sp. RHCl1 TaxID=2995320 RepID=UPI00248AA8AF|nr:CPBP family intramembrane glutamic endopeptidase [Thalassomonas sp. RHCl1]